MTLPNFFLIGAAKSGTTALYSFLKQHPEVFLPERKEPHFFAFQNQELRFRGPGVTINKAITRIDEYRRLYANVAGESAIGDCSASYLYVQGTCERIHDLCPDAKIIAILRNPIDRAYSSYLHLVREGREPLDSFEAALEAEQDRIAQDWGLLWRYADLGRYAAQLERYLAAFGRERVRVFLYDELRSDPQQLMHDTFEFLGVDSEFTPDLSARPNVSGVPQSRWLHKLLRAGGAARTLVRATIPTALKVQLRDWYFGRGLRQPPMHPELRERLRREFRDDILKTQQLIERDLSHWLA